MSGGGKGGSQTTSVEVPAWLEDAAQQNLARADQVAQTGYVPYMGPDVAAMAPLQQAAMQNTAGAAGAFGLSAPSNPMAGMPEAQTFSGGVLGHSSAPLYQESLGALQEVAPAQYDHITGMFIDPVTGEPPRAPFGQSVQSATTYPPQSFSGSSSNNNSISNSGSSGGAGFASIGDMFDGGGAGASGDAFQGGGLISSVANKVTSPRESSGGGSMGGGK